MATLIMNWQQFKEQLMQRFCAFEVEEEARYKLDRLRQHTSVAKYAEEFNKCMVELPTMDEKDRVHRFVEGLKPEVRKWIRLQKPSTVAAAISLATHADHTVWAGRFHPSPYATSPPSSKGDGQPVPMELDAAHFHRPKHSSFSRPDRTTITCWRCGQSGHMRFECRNTPNTKKPDVRRAAQSN
jgi:hypothetical protein